MGSHVGGGGGGGGAGAWASRNPKLALALLPLALVSGFLLGRWSSGSSSSTGGVARLGGAAVGKAGRVPAKGAFWLVVSVVFQQEADVATFERAFQPLVTFVADQEFNTISYAFAKSDRDPKRILIFERYASKSDYLDVHKASAPFIAFRPQLAALNAQIEGHSYYEGGLGFV